jgi:hypothetical protein
MSGALQAVFQNIRSFVTTTYYMATLTNSDPQQTGYTVVAYPDGTMGLTAIGFNVCGFIRISIAAISNASTPAVSNYFTIYDTGQARTATVTDIKYNSTNSRLYVIFADGSQNPVGNVVIYNSPTGVGPTVSTQFYRLFTNTEVYSINSDTSGNVYLSGNQLTDVPCVGFKRANFRAKLSASGALSWAFGEVGGSSISYENTLIDSSNNTYAAGYVGGCYPTGTYISKYDSSGVNVWRYLVGVYYSGTPQLAISGNDLYLLSSTYTGGQYFLDLVKLNATTCAFVSRIRVSSGTATGFVPIGVSVGADGFIYAAGRYSSSDVSPSKVRTILMKFDSSLTVQWQREFSAYSPSLFANINIGNAGKNGLAVDSNNNIYLNTVVYNSSPCNSTARQFVAKLPSSGSFTGVRTFSGYQITCAASSFTVSAGSTLTPSTYSVTSTTTLTGTLYAVGTSNTNITPVFSSSVI